MNARYINERGERFSQKAVHSGGLVHSIVSKVFDSIWAIDNQMQRFVELAGGTNCVPSFTYSLGQAGSCDGLVSRTLWDDHAKKKKKSLSKLFPVTYFWLSLELNEVLFMSWFNNARWFTFKLEIVQLSDALQEGG